MNMCLAVFGLFCFQVVTNKSTELVCSTKSTSSFFHTGDKLEQIVFGRQFYIQHPSKQEIHTLKKDIEDI